MTPTPVKGKVYRHFKGAKYRIIAVTLGGDFQPKYQAPTHWAKHTETEQTLGCWYGLDDDALTTLDGAIVRDRLVLYWLDSEQPGIVWARPLDNFLETLCAKEEGNHTCNYYRFTKEQSA